MPTPGGGGITSIHVHDEYALDTDLTSYVQQSTLTAKGALYVASASGVVTQLPAGADDQVPVWNASAANGLGIEPKTLEPLAMSIPFIASSVSFSGTPPAAGVADRPSANSAHGGEGTYIWADLTGYTQARFYIVVTTAFSTGVKVVPQYSTDGGTSWNYLEQSGTTFEFPVDSDDGTADPGRLTAYANIDADARTAVHLRLAWYNTGSTPSGGTIRQCWLWVK